MGHGTSPLYHSLQSPSGAWGLTPQPGFPDSPRALVGLSAGPVGHRQPGSVFPRSPAAGEGIAPYPAFGADSLTASMRDGQRCADGQTCPGRPTSSPESPRVGVRSKGGYPSAALSAGRAPISWGTPFPRQPNACGGIRWTLRPRHQPGRGSPPPYRAGPAGSRPRAQGNLNKASPIATHSLQTRTFSGSLITRSQPRQSGTRPLFPQAIPPGHLPPEHPLER
jgi:hypothetical protein